VTTPSDRSPSTVRPWQLVSETASRGPSGYMRLLTRRYVTPDGREGDWDLLATAEATVAIVALTGGDEVVLARQFRPGPGEILDELPGGMVDPGEDVAHAAARELREETGYVGEIELVGATWLSAYAITRRHVAVARGCTRVAEPELGHNEFAETVLVDFAGFRTLLRSGALTDADLGYRALDHLALL
jgi:ADP-ribose pyrophosphatase